nr:hypothetical protein CFP56_63720 [Quercus suber]
MSVPMPMVLHAPSNTPSVPHSDREDDANSAACKTACRKGGIHRGCRNGKLDETHAFRIQVQQGVGAESVRCGDNECDDVLRRERQKVVDDRAAVLSA